MKDSSYQFFIVLLMSSLATNNFAMEKEKPSLSLLNSLTHLFKNDIASKQENLIEQLFDGIQKNNLDKIKDALNKGANCNTPIYIQKRKAYLSLLHAAIKYNNSEAVKLLLEAGAYPFTHQSFLLIDEKDTFPLSLLPVGTTPGELYHKFMILSSFAKTMADKNLKKEYEQFIIHIRKLTETYVISDNSQSSDNDHIENQVELVKLLNFYLIESKKPELIPHAETIFHIIQLEGALAYPKRVTLDNGLPVLGMQVCANMHNIMCLYDKHPKHPTIKLYINLYDPHKYHEEINSYIQNIKSQHQELINKDKDIILFS